MMWECWSGEGVGTKQSVQRSVRGEVIECSMYMTAIESAFIAQGNDCIITTAAVG